MRPSYEKLCKIIRQYELEYRRKGEMKKEDREAVEWAIENTKRKPINRDGEFGY